VGNVKHFRITFEGKSYDITVDDPAANPVRVTVDGDTFEISLESLDDVPVAPAHPTAPSSATLRPVPAPSNVEPDTVSDHVLRAPMPGTINKVSVRPGDKVEYGQELCVLEAMKMNNVLCATGPGLVAEVRVSEKQSVQHGDVLVVFES
jgi:biotin carboxyl carrier protein